jgi:hypothetical protein
MRLQDIKPLAEKQTTEVKFPFFELIQMKKAVEAPRHKIPEGLTREEKLEWLITI